MKNLIPYTFFALILILSSCNLKDVITPVIKDSTIVVGGNPDTGTNTGTGTTTNPTGSSGTTNSTSYMPLTKGSSWKYAEQFSTQSSDVDTVIITMTDRTESIGSRTYLVYVNTLMYGGDTDEYIYFGSNMYFLRTNNDASATFQDIPILKDNAAVNTTWTTDTNSGGGGSTGRYLGTMKEKDITYTVNGKVYSNVYHTVIQEQIGFFGQYSTSTTYDYYFAKGVGIIKSFETFATGSVVHARTITSYTVK